MSPPPGVQPSLELLQAEIDALSDQLCCAVDGDFSLRVTTESGNERLQKLTMLLNFVIDTARRSIAEVQRQGEEIRHKEARFRELFENMNDGVVVFEAEAGGEDFVIRDINPASLAIERLARRDVVDHRATDAFPGIADFGLLDLLRRVHVTGVPEQLPVRLYRDSRVSGWRENFVYRLPTCEVVVVYRDVTEKKLAEQALRSSLESTEKLIDAAPIALVVVGPDGIVRRANEVADRILGSAPGEMVGREWSAFTSDNSNERSPRLTEEGVLKDIRGNSVEVLMSVIPANLGGEDVVYIEAFLDLTERKRLENRLRQSQKLEAVGHMAAGIAHEINSPTQYVGENTRFIQTSFQAIRGACDAQAELLRATRAGVVTPELVERVEQAVESAGLEYLFTEIPTCVDQTLEGVEQISRIVRAMKEFSHPGNKEKKPSNLNRAIESTVIVAHGEWKYVADLVLNLAPDLPEVTCFVGDINQAVLNLIVNATHAIEDVARQSGGGKGRITVSTSHDGEVVEVRVADTGTGIPVEHQPHVFEPFFTTKDVGKGTGQGLSVVYSTIVNTHGGAVTFQTEPGKGTTFILRLPIAPQAAEPTKRWLDAA